MLNHAAITPDRIRSKNSPSPDDQPQDPKPYEPEMMNPHLTEQDGRDALRGHIVEKASQARLKYGLYIDADVIEKMLDDRQVVRYPTGLRFDDNGLEPGEFAYAAPLGDKPADGFCLFIHPWFETQREILPLLVAYHIPVINYGSEIISHEEAELYGSTLLGLEQNAYYDALCELVDSIPGEPAFP